MISSRFQNLITISRWRQGRCRGRGVSLINRLKSELVDELISNELTSTIRWMVLVPEHILASVFAQDRCWNTR